MHHNLLQMFSQEFTRIFYVYEKFKASEDALMSWYSNCQRRNVNVSLLVLFLLSWIMCSHYFYIFLLLLYLCLLRLCTQMWPIVLLWVWVHDVDLPPPSVSPAPAMTIHSVYILSKSGGLIYQHDHSMPTIENEKTFSYPLELKLDVQNRNVVVSFGQRDGIKGTIHLPQWTLVSLAPICHCKASNICASWSTAFDLATKLRIL